MDKKGADLQRIEEKVGKDNSLVLRPQHQIHPKVCPDCGHNDYIFEENDSLLICNHCSNAFYDNNHSNDLFISSLKKINNDDDIILVVK